MKYARFIDGGLPRYGLVQHDAVTFINGDIFGEHSLSNVTRGLESLELLPPCSPSKAIGIGLNYREHAREVGAPLPTEPRFFIKPSTSIVGPGADIVWPRQSKQVDYEAEMVVVIARRAKNVEPDDALRYVLGYTCGNDVTARDLQRQDKMPNRAKAFDTFGPIGPFIATDLDPDALKLECLVNGEVRQSGSTSDLVFSTGELVSFLSKIMTLLPGDLIFTGTPSGIGTLRPGDLVEIRIEGIGTLQNSVVMPEEAEFGIEEH